MIPIIPVSVFAMVEKIRHIISKGRITVVNMKSLACLNIIQTIAHTVYARLRAGFKKSMRNPNTDTNGDNMDVINSIIK